VETIRLDARRIRAAPLHRSHRGLQNLGLRELCQRYCDERWIAAHLTPEQAAESVLDEFKRVVQQVMELLEVESAEG
jgi:hypothetical protein